MLLVLAVLGAVTVDAGWLVLAGFCAAFGAAMWKLLPWAIKSGLEEVIEAQVKPLTLAIEEKITTVNERIDSHMATEENNFESMVNDMGAVRAQLDERTALFVEIQQTMDRSNDVLTKHMTQDEHQFALAAESLAKTQETLLDRIDAIETRKQSAKRRKE